MSEPILFSVDDGLGRITLNRPARLNAFDEATARAWERITAEVVDRDDVGAILLDAEGPSFCAGGDVLSMAAGGFSADGIAELAGVINRGILSLTESSKPVVAAAQGTTAGGGLGILLASDYAVVGEDSRIGSLYANMGLTPDLSVTAQLGRAVGQRRALQLVLQDRLLSAAEAVEWGLVAEAVAPDQVRPRAEAVARFWLAGAGAAYGQAKRLVRTAPERTVVAQLEDEARTIGAALATPDAQARVAAFAAASRTSAPRP
ncbi:enoyl-CoA hydratase/isomerase family protein [Microbacterium sp. zg.B48]|uniref:enoyl-CoA hydratase/isomerase family protein n=1 Tax=unclassified Microbacterium TaxID=2609290 RepID=UPI00214A97FE|nr:MULTISPECIES: enoyl-CoA hydratase/isomerase family protein [unclassified Microbacterium]MCR2763012.1 enoyl-CoA hydratase/isomerase family protein [Microbacterium sp. zg.B48]MCR2808673.1 enoyl-CoA hydratase/isomerase family protein [Microbacterium sp. zg.B185]WIM18895.1 enoyl-CoA hydratase/isomerase family protein [Microbacterium sp. zg-B185]